MTNCDRLQSYLVDTINHELRTPLTTMLGHAELLQDLQPDLPEAARLSIEAIVRAGDGLLDLANSVSLLLEPDHTSLSPRCQAELLSLVRQVASDWPGGAFVA